MVTTKRLTDKGLAALKPKAERYEIRDAARRGLSVRVGPSGTVSFVYRYQLAGKRRKMTLGQYGTPPTATLAAAHLAHAEAVALVRQGIDPQPEPARTPEVRQFTVTEAAEEFRDRHLKREVATWAEAWRILEKDVLPAWGDRYLETITARDAVELLDQVRDRGLERTGRPADRMAQRIRSLMFQLWRFAIARGMTASSPLVAVALPARKNARRERVLTDEEIREFWQRIDTAAMLPRIRHALRLLLVTGQRRSEVTGATWAEFEGLDGKQPLWRIPKERTKSRREHTVPLPRMAVAVLEQLRADLAQVRSGDGYSGAYLFPSQHWDQDEAIDPKAITRAVSRNRKHWNVAPFTAHDLRRTVRSNLAALGVSPVVARKVVNHSLDGMDAVYDRHDYLDEKRAALTLWADRLAGIIGGAATKVAPIRGAA